MSWWCCSQVRACVLPWPCLEVPPCPAPFCLPLASLPLLLSSLGTAASTHSPHRYARRALPTETTHSVTRVRRGMRVALNSWLNCKLTGAPSPPRPPVCKSGLAPAKAPAEMSAEGAASAAGAAAAPDSGAGMSMSVERTAVAPAAVTAAPPAVAARAEGLWRDSEREEKGRGACARLSFFVGLQKSGTSSFQVRPCIVAPSTVSPCISLYLAACEQLFLRGRAACLPSTSLRVLLSRLPSPLRYRALLLFLYSYTAADEAVGSRGLEAPQ